MNRWTNFFITLFLGFLGVHKFMQHKIGMGFLYLFTLGLCGIGWIYDIVKALMVALSPQVAHSSTPKAPTVDLTGYTPAYSYTNVEIYCPEDVISHSSLTLIPCGVALTLKQEPENTYDNKAIAIYYSSQKIGYLHRNRLQDMANEYISRGLPIIAIFTAAGDENALISLDYFKPAN